MGAALIVYMMHRTEVEWSAHMLWADYKEQQQAAAAQNAKKATFWKKGARAPLHACVNPVNQSSRFAYVSMLSHRIKEYAPGAARLGESLRAHNPHIDRVLLEMQDAPIPPQFARQLRSWTRCVVPRIHGPRATPTSSNRFLEAGIYTKLRGWQLSEYEAILMLDLDIMAWRDPSDVFTTQLALMRAANKTVAAVRDRPLQNSKCCTLLRYFPFYDRFNAGVLLVQPTETEFGTLMTAIETLPHNSHVDAEQAFLNAAYGERVHELPIAYNAFSILKVCEAHTWQKYEKREELKLIHFTASKPWTYSIPHYWHNPHALLSCWFWGMEEMCALWELLP
jgi:hypothetical protein